MTAPPVRLKVLLRERHWQTYRTFNAEYDKAARKVDPSLVGRGPSRAQLHRWMTGDMKGLPYPDHCRVLEKMLPSWTAEQLFEHITEDQPAKPQAATLTVETTSLADQPIELESGEWGANLTGHIVELSIRCDIDIDPDGWSHVTYQHELLNMSDRPLTRLAREVWFENTREKLIIVPTLDSQRRVMIRRVHDTANLSKFSCQISPPLQPGESAIVGFQVEGGQFVEDHYWRQSIPRYVRHYSLRIRHQGAGQLLGCWAVEEHPDGSENSADAGLVWDYEGDDVVIRLEHDYLRPNQALTTRWDVPHESA